MTPEQLYQMQQAYQKQDIIGNAKRAKQVGDQRRAERQMSMSQLASSPSEVVGVLNKMSAQNDLQNKQNEMVNRQAYQNQLLDKQIQNRSGLGNTDNIVNAGAVNNKTNTSGSNVVPTSNGIKSGSLFDATKKIDDQGLKYSMKRGKGCTDCSAFTQNVYKDTFGVDIGGWTGSQKNAGVSVNPSERKYGDLVFFNTDGGKRTGGISHVGYDNGDGTFTHFSSSNGGGIRTTPYKGYYPVVDTRRVI